MKRIRVELDADDAVDIDALRGANVLGLSETSQQATIEVRSVPGWWKE